jgi:hypothetical protein
MMSYRLRHPPEPVYPNIIFLREKPNKRNKTKPDVVRLYQDMIRYSISRQYRDKLQKQKGFGVDDMGRWLLHNNPYFKKRYSGSKAKTGELRKLKVIRDTTKRYLEHLGKWWIVKKGDADPKNRIKGWLYRYGRVGLIIAWMLEYRSSLDKSYDSGKQVAKNEIFGLLQRRFKDSRLYNSYKEEFLAEFYHKLIEYDNNNNNNNDNNQSGLCDGVIRQIISAFENESHNKAFDYFDHLQTILLKPVGDLQTKQTILNLYLQTLEEVPKDTCEMVMYHDKDFFENKMSMSQPRKEWSKIWKENRTNYDTIVICCTCKNNDCPRYNNDGTLVCDYYSYITARSLSAEDSYSQMDCPECKTQKSLYVYDTMNNLIDGIMNNSF